MLYLFIGCLSGSSYPKQLATNTCQTAFKCVSQDEIEDYFGYNDVNDCISDIEDSVQKDSSYKDWKSGDNDFNKENAEACLSEITDVGDDSDCDGSMSIFSFLLDITTSECSQVYE